MNQPIKTQQQSQNLLSQRVKKRCYKSLGTSVINSTISSPSLVLITNDLIINICFKFHVILKFLDVTVNGVSIYIQPYWLLSKYYKNKDDNIPTYKAR